MTYASLDGATYMLCLIADRPEGIRSKGSYSPGASAARVRLQSLDRAGVPDTLVGTERLHDAFAMTGLPIACAMSKA